MSTEKDKEQEQEQITNIPKDLEEKPEKVQSLKDPRKVAAGKALAKKNSEARKALKKQVETFSFADVTNNLQTIATTIGAGFTIYHAYKFFYPNGPKGLKGKEEKPPERKLEVVETNYVEEEEPPERKPPERKKERKRNDIMIDMD